VKLYKFVMRYLWLLLCRLLNTYTQMDISVGLLTIRPAQNNSVDNLNIKWFCQINSYHNFGPETVNHTRKMNVSEKHYFSLMSWFVFLAASMFQWNCKSSTLMFGCNQCISYATLCTQYAFLGHFCQSCTSVIS